MSRSEPEVESRSPVVRWFQWEALTGAFSYWDKEAKQRVQVDAPFTFLLLDQLATVTGYSEDLEAGMYSNEVRMSELRKIPMVVKTNKTNRLIADGIWSDIKERVKALGGNFAYSLYVLIDVDGKKVIGNVCLKGAALAAFMDFSRTIKIYEGAVSWRGETEEGTKGSVTYQCPVFTQNSITEETGDMATVLDREVLQPYLKQRVSGTDPRDEDDPPIPVGADNAHGEEDIPF